jgi:hypothetical protein
MAKRKKDTTNIILGGAIGVASGFAVNYLYDAIVYCIIMNKQRDIYYECLNKFGDRFYLWWKIQFTGVALENKQITQEEYDQTINDLGNQYPDVSLPDMVEPEEYYLSKAVWTNKPEYFRIRFGGVAVAGVIASILPFVTNIRNSYLKYVFWGAGLTAIYRVYQVAKKGFRIGTFMAPTGIQSQFNTWFYNNIFNPKKDWDQSILWGLDTSIKKAVESEK